MAFRRTLRLSLASVALMATVAVPAARVVAADGSALVGLCRQYQGTPPALGPQACRSLLAAEWGLAAACRTPFFEVPLATAPEACAAIDGRPVSEARVDAYEHSWVHKALSLQRDLAAPLPLLDAPLLHTHNSFNSSAYRLPRPDKPVPSYFATVTNQDPNQVYDLTDQLRMDMRAIEVDVHWVPSPWSAAPGGSGGPFEVTACHGTSKALGSSGATVHVGCSWDRPFADTLAEIKAWLVAHPDQFVVVYLENQLDGSTAGHERAGQLVAQGLGSLVYQPPTGQPCAGMPMDVSAADILASGHQVLLVGNCDVANGAGTSWGTYVHARGPAWDESGDPTGYDDADCAADLAKRTSAAPVFRRYFEEVTWLAAMGDTAPQTAPAGHTFPITADGAARMARCGVNIIGLDQLTPADPRLEAQVWSWAVNEPSAGGRCAYQGSDSRFHAGSCRGVAATRPFACIDGAGAWHVTAAVGEWSAGDATCAAELPGSSFAVPRNGWSNQALSAARASAGAGQVWLDYRRAAGSWQS